MGAVPLAATVKAKVLPALMVWLTGWSVIVGLLKTVIAWLRLLWLPQASAAVQVRVSITLPAIVPETEDSARVTVGVGSQLSTAVGDPAAGMELANAVVSEGTPLKTGAVVSLMVIVWLRLPLFPQTSVAVHVRVKVYVPTQLPGEVVSWRLMLGLLSQLSVAVGVATAGIALHSVDTSAGTPTSIGAVVSTTVIC